MSSIKFVSDPGAQNSNLRLELLQAMERVLDSGWYILGKEVEKFEHEFATYSETKHCVGVANGTDAITLALLAFGIGPGDEVICPSHTATFTALGISATGATPVFADITEATFTIDPEDIARKITPKTKAIIPVHLYGHPADMDPILALAKKHNLRVVEDVAQAHGAKYKGKRVGSMGDAGCFSFYPTKNLGALGDGGAITTNTAETATAFRELRNGGQASRYDHVRLGRNSRLDELQAAMLSIKLAHLDEWNEQRRSLAAAYTAALERVENIRLPQVASWAEPVFHLYVIRVREREKFMDYLKQSGVPTQIHYPIPAHRQPIYGSSGDSLPITDRIVEDIVSLPIYPELPLSQVERITGLIQKALPIA